nr:MAG TPA: hypothetical protein [Caudoviricetes sp.]
MGSSPAERTILRHTFCVSLFYYCRKEEMEWQMI